MSVYDPRSDPLYGKSYEEIDEILRLKNAYDERRGISEGNRIPVSARVPTYGYDDRGEVARYQKMYNYYHENPILNEEPSLDVNTKFRVQGAYIYPTYKGSDGRIIGCPDSYLSYEIKDINYPSRFEYNTPNTYKIECKTQCPGLPKYFNVPVSALNFLYEDNKLKIETRTRSWWGGGGKRRRTKRAPKRNRRHRRSRRNTK